MWLRHQPEVSCPVPPYCVPIISPFHVPVVIVPKVEVPVTVKTVVVAFVVVKSVIVASPRASPRLVRLFASK